MDYSKIKLTVTGNASIPWEKRDDWQKTAHGYRVQLAYQGRKMTLDFWQGSAHTNEPTAEGVLECLISDASGFDNAGSFEEWAADLGFNTDSRKAEKDYRQVERQTKSLKRLLGSDYESFLYPDSE